MREVIKEISSLIELRSSFSIDITEAGKDRTHPLISHPPDIAVTSIARRLKQESACELRKRYPDWLRRHFWKERSFWSDGYFVCSIGEASFDTVRKHKSKTGDSPRISIPP